jgi:hypothetical protein
MTFYPPDLLPLQDSEGGIGKRISIKPEILEIPAYFIHELSYNAGDEN